MIKLLNEKELEFIYEDSMRDTFPRMELKPLKAMKRMQGEGRYDVWGYYNEENELLAYACLCTAATPVLLDYLGVYKNHRGGGIGSEFLAELAASESYSAVMMDIEAVSDAIDEADRAVRARRQRFYERLGFVVTTTDAHVFGEHYMVLDNQTHLGVHDVTEAMEAIYHYMVPEKDAYNKNITIKTMN